MLSPAVNTHPRNSTQYNMCNNTLQLTLKSIADDGRSPNSAKKTTRVAESSAELLMVRDLGGSFSLAFGSVTASIMAISTNSRGSTSWVIMACQNLIVLYSLFRNMA